MEPTRRSIFRKVAKAIETIESSSDASSTIAGTAGAVIDNFREELGIYGGRIYECRDGGYELTRTFGAVPPVPPGFTIPAEYPPIQRILDEGVVVMDRGAPGVDAELESQIGADRFAAIAVGSDKYILAFSVDPHVPEEDLSASLNILRYAVDHKLKEERFASALDEARQIQMSILPRRAPSGGEFEFAGFTVPAEAVGGDFFDFVPVSDRIYGIAIADASGHGLQAALQVRDVYTGLRMGVSRDFKIVRTVERLNRIINQSRMTTKFVSLFYGEIEQEGNFIYVNAGHPPPLHFHAKGVTPLKQTGMVLGPSATSTYSRGFLSLEKGDALLLYTDGMIEATDAKGREYGIERLKKAFFAERDRPADEIVRNLADGVKEFLQGLPPEDDRTVVVVKRAGSPKATDTQTPEARSPSS